MLIKQIYIDHNQLDDDPLPFKIMYTNIVLLIGAHDSKW